MPPPSAPRTGTPSTTTRPTCNGIRKITRAVGRLKIGLQSKLFLGNLQASRDWGFAGVCRAVVVKVQSLLLNLLRPSRFSNPRHPHKQQQRVGQILWYSSSRFWHYHCIINHFSQDFTCQSLLRMKALQESQERQAPYAGAFLVKDEPDADPSVVSSSNTEKVYMI
ncbi:uncharacterized protein LOC130723625 [Lotus japonicus]|uniref:uncharacterized protein LOC130723625 n=1 Tax=Lotus japonicus TaxID=34305 RepID=UPI0025898C1D|nr:uncharacterized protein LOC130723625 [Lotus japonicus]